MSLEARFVDITPEEDSRPGNDSKCDHFTEAASKAIDSAKQKNNEACELAQKGDLASLNAAIEISQQAMDEICNHPLHSTSLSNNMIHYRLQRYKWTGNNEDLELSIKIGNNMLNPIGTSEMDPKHLSEISLQAGIMSLGLAYRFRFGQRGETEDLKLAISHVSKALAMPGWEEQSPDAEIMFELGEWNLQVFAKTRELSDLNMSIKNYEQALCSTYPDRVKGYLALAKALQMRFEVTSDITSLKQSIQVMQEALRVTPPEHPDLPQLLANLSYCFEKLFEYSRQDSDLDKAIEALKAARKLVHDRGGERTCPLERLDQLTENSEIVQDRNQGFGADKSIFEDVQEGPMLAVRLADLLLKRWDCGRAEDDLNCGIKLLTNAKRSFEKHTKSYQSISLKLLDSLTNRWEHLQKIEDLDQIVVTLRFLIDCLPLSHPKRCDYVMALVTHQMNHYIASGKPDDLEELLRMAESGLEAASPGFERSRWLQLCGYIQDARSSVSGDLKPMQDAVKSAYNAIQESRSEANPDHEVLFRAGLLLARLCRQSGNIRDLDKGLEAMNESLNYIDRTSIEAGTRMSHLAWWHMVRSDRTGDGRDLKLAIELGEKAVAICHDARSLSTLSQCYEDRYLRNRDHKDLDKSIDILKGWPDEKNGPCAIDLRLQLAKQLYKRGQIRKRIEDANGSIKLHENILEAIPEGGEYWVDCHYGLGMALKSRYVDFNRHTDPSSLDDIDYSIRILNKVKGQSLTMDLRGMILYELGKDYQTRLMCAKTQDPLDAQRALDCFLECFHQQTASLAVRIRAAEQAARTADCLSRSDEALSILKQAIDLLPALNLRSLSTQDQQEMLKTATGLASMATAMEFKCDPQSDEAFRILERGRGIISSLLSEERMMMSMLDPDLASEFLEAKRAVSTLQSTTSGPSASLREPGHETQVPQLDIGARHAAENRLFEVIKRIEDDPKTKHVFEPPLMKEVSDALGDDNIAVINVSEIRCDAVVMSRRTGIRQAQLPHLTLDDINTQARKLRDSRPRIDPSLLEWLWYMIGEPVTRGLELEVPANDQPLPRLFWILTGPLAQLPVHAAGRHHEATKKTILDRVMSSYCSSLRSFINSRTAKVPTSPQEQEGTLGKALLIAMEQTPKHSPLFNAKKEINAVEDVCRLLHLKALRLPAQIRAAVLKELDALIFHFAGHGRSDASDPSQSGLLLEDGALTVAEIREHKANGKLPFLAFLSACLTAANDAPLLADESIHLLTACQVAGFRHLIGSLWQLYDDACVEIAEAFYENLASRGMTDRSVCEALHFTCVQSRDVWVATNSMATATQANSISSGSDKTDCSVVSSRGDVEKNPREARLAKKMSAGVHLVKADWVPYVHYGP
ncbi:hypothetical protein IL306_004745 [Fusarium sp. DS 682]|nr:hypothetical protein IL306_004745 [Fusarium sp. DS 682]